MARVADAPNRAADDEQKANFDKYLSAVKVINRAAGQIRIGKNSVSEEAGSRGVGEVMEKFPEVASELDAVEGSDDDDDEQIERGGADGVFKRLKRRPHGKSNIHEAERRARVQKQRKRMEACEGERGVTGPAMNAKNVEAPVRPVAHRAIASKNHQADEDVGGGESNGDEAEIGRYVEHRHAKRNSRRSFPAAVRRLR